ncbi:conserved hypothetical protein [Thermotomaculum hydrothermale]|uniref:CBS domain-containing protein n=1 Tax=Thermotomaculum hydrothermale TaxID=981385 RepID=A0A7R6PLN9_9BACT|nr:hemolysin family protein [Thermotomaculum hydrothermale]BBB32377.1 conserved hypothetical protein [Thermotomaculum hydrothermale]
MENIFLVFIIIFRLISVALKFAYNNLTLIDLKKISEKEEDVEKILETRISMQFVSSFLNELTVIFLGLLFYLKISDIKKAILLVVIYLLIEKVIVGLLGFISREKIVKMLMPVLSPLYFVVKVFVFPAYKLSLFLIKKEDIRLDDEEDKEDEERAFIDVATEEGIIEEGEKDLIKGVLEFGDTIVREVMTPRTDIIAVQESISYESLIEKFKEAKHSRLPVFRDSIDNIIGIVHLKDILASEKEKFNLSKIIQKPYFIPETKKVLELLREMQNNKLKMAIVLDEYGGTAGVVTIEDLVEEIVGEIDDEHDIARNVIQKINETTYIVDGSCNIHFFAEETGIELDFEDVDTLGGVVFTIFGRIPQEGESVEYENIKITVEKMTNRRVKTIKVELLNKENEND